MEQGRTSPGGPCSLQIQDRDKFTACHQQYPCVFPLQTGSAASWPEQGCHAKDNQRAFEDFQAERVREEVGRHHHSLLLGEGAVLLRGWGGLLQASLEKKVAWCHVMGTSVLHQSFCFLIINGCEQLGHAKQILCTKTQLSERGASAHRVHSGRTYPLAARPGKEAPPAGLMNV